MIKKLLSMFLALCMVITIAPATAFAALGDGKDAAPSSNKTPFSDVKETDWFYNAVQYAHENGLFSGTSATSFGPNGSMTRGMFVTVLGRMAGVDTADYTEAPKFSDVSSSAYYSPYVAWAVEKGITTGVGGGKFNPDGMVSRQQMAAFTVRFFDAYNFTYPEATVKTLPKDADSIADYARDAVLKLWACGMLAGDSGNFNPDKNASRAETATFMMRMDNHLIEAGFRERPAEKPSEEKPEEKPGQPSGNSNSSGNSGGNNGGNNGGSTTYYEVTCAMGAGESGTSVTLPETKTYPSGTKITSLPTPYQQNRIFLGWYYDKEMSRRVESSDTVNRNMTIYADMADNISIVSEFDTPSYITKTDVSPGFTFKVRADSEDELKAALTIKSITANNTALTYTVSGSGTFTVSADYAPGQTYKAELANTGTVVFVIDGIEQQPTIRTLNFITKMAPVQNLSLSDGIIYLPSASVSNMTGTALDGLFVASVTNIGKSSIDTNTSTGTFDYGGGGIKEGDTVAIYSGTRPDLRNGETAGTDADGSVSYITVTNISGATYTYTAANAEQVLFKPDVLPVKSDADTDGDSNNNSITVPASTFVYDSTYANMGLDATTTVDAGDYLAFYTGERESGELTSYAKIFSVGQTGVNQETYIISYTPVAPETVLASMDIYNEREEKVELTGEEIQQIEADMEMQAINSGFVDEAAEYLVALAMETDGFQELSGDMDLKSYNIALEDGTPLSDGEMALMAGSRAEITEKKVEATVAAGKVLQHFEGKYGVRAELSMTFKVEIDVGNGNKIVIRLQSIFEQEVLLTVNTSGGAIWKWAWIFPYIYDYQLNANIDVGTFTGIGITASAYTQGEEDEAFDWKNVSGDSTEQKILDIGKQITELMEAKEEFLGEKLVDKDGEEIELTGSNGGGLADKYSAMMRNAEDSWIEIIRTEIFSVSGSVDPFHILVYGVGADFVVSANMYVTLGMTFEYGNAKRYNFSLMLFHKKSTSETIDLEESHYQFDFYVMGTIGIRAGIELEVAVGLFSLKLDSIGITAEVGAYAQLCGYFYYSLSWSKSAGKNSSYAGAMHIEIGVYLEIKFKAQLFSSSKLTYNPTLYENKWPLWSAGEAENVYDFVYQKKDTPEFVWYADKTLTMPESLFTMKFIDLASGEQDEKVFNNTDFYVSFSNPSFSYNTATNTLTVSPEKGSIEEAGEMYIAWFDAPLAMTSRPISRTIALSWSDPASGHYIKFDSNGGSLVNMIFKGEGAFITLPASPIKKGYVFGGWYEDSRLTKPYAFPGKMPAANTTVYAKWIPATDTRYTVRHYQQNLNDNGYTLVDTDVRQGTTDSYTTAIAKDYYGFTLKSLWQQLILPDGSTVVNVYYDRNEYTAVFTYGDMRDVTNPDTNPVSYTKRYGSTIYAPKLAIGGYIFNGFTGWPTAVQDGKRVPAENITLTQDAAYVSAWTADPNTPYRVEHYIQRISGSGYLLDSVEQRSGETNTSVILAGLASPSGGLTYTGGTVEGKSVTETKIKGDGNLVIKLYYDRNFFDITYKIGTETHVTEQVRYGANITAPEAPGWEGYLFAGWYEDEELKIPYTFGNPMPDGNFTIYGKKEPGEKSYTIQHYVMNIQGTYELHSTETGTGKTGDVLTLPALTDSTIPVENGIIFKEGKVGNVVKLNHTLPATGSVTFALYYERLNKTYTFIPGNGEENIEVTRLYGAAVTSPSVSRTGYTFNGWSPELPDTVGIADAAFTAQWLANTNTPYKVEHYMQNAINDSYTLNETENLAGTTDSIVNAVSKSYPNYTLNVNASGTISSGTVLPDGTLALKLYYDRNTFTVTFNANGGILSGEPAKTLRHGAAVSTTNPAREGYAFGGWYLDSGADKLFDGIMPASSLTVYAKWVAGQCNYTVEHYVMQTNGSYPTTANKTDNLTGIADSALTLADLKDAALEFANGIVYKNGEVNGQVVTNTTVAADGSRVIKLYYERKQHNLSWNLNGGSASNSYTQGPVYYDSDITAPNAVKLGHSLTWDPVPAGRMPAADTTYKALWTANNYTITFISNGGTAVAPIEQAYGSTVTPPTNPTRTGYSFNGWLKDGNPYTINTMPAENMTLTASWQANKYSFSLELNGGALSGYGTTMHTYDQQTVLPTASDITKAGHIFRGWYLAENFSGTVQTSIAGTQTWEGTRTYYAKWEPEKYTITFVYNNGIVDYVKDNVTYGTAFSSIKPSDPTRKGYQFKGWSPEAAAVTKAQTFTAQWEVITYDITYNNIPENGINENPSSYTVEDTITLLEPRAPAKSFTGWTYDGKTVPEKEAEISNGNTGSKTFTANWNDMNSYTIKYIVDGEWWTGSGPDTYSYNPNAKVALPTPPTPPGKPGYIFAGWREEGASKNIYKIPKGDYGNKIYTAQWTFALASDAWVISDEDGLARFRDLVNAGSTSLDVKLSNDIVLDEYKNWTPIGFNASAASAYDTIVANKAYTGTFDGQGFTVSGLDAKWTAVYDEMRQGFFQYVDGGTVKNLVLEGSMNIQQGYNVANFTAGIVGELISGSISGCTSRISAEGSGRITFGGIVGELKGGTVDNCRNEVGSTWSTDGYMGGIVGRMISGTVSNCINTGNFTSTYPWGTIGGIAAITSGSSSSTPIIRDCTNRGSLQIARRENVHGYVGGILGMAWSIVIIEGCIVADIGTVTLEGGYYTAGIVGATNYSVMTTVKNCAVGPGLTLIGALRSSGVSDYYSDNCWIRPICPSTYLTEDSTDNTYEAFRLILYNSNFTTSQELTIPAGTVPQVEGGVQSTSYEGENELQDISDEGEDGVQNPSDEGENGVQNPSDEGENGVQDTSDKGANEMQDTSDEGANEMQDIDQ